MMKVSFRNIVVYIFLKYLIFYIFLMFRNNDYTLISVSTLQTFQDWFFYLFIFLFLPVLNILLFTGPIYYLLKLKKITLFVILWVVCLLIEYVIYTRSASQLDLMNGVYLEIIGILLFLLFFYRHIVLIFKQQAK